MDAAQVAQIAKIREGQRAAAPVYRRQAMKVSQHEDATIVEQLLGCDGSTFNSPD